MLPGASETHIPAPFLHPSHREVGRHCSTCFALVSKPIANIRTPQRSQVDRRSRQNTPTLHFAVVCTAAVVVVSESFRRNYCDPLSPSAPLEYRFPRFAFALARPFASR
jgi:hypothetical protein